MPEHTPGPWHVGETATTIVFASDHYAVCDAKVFHHVRDDSEPAANARLIAAAPDLLAALRLFLADERFQVTVGGNPNAVEQMLAQARAAIAKAEGGR